MIPGPRTPPQLTFLSGSVSRPDFCSQILNSGVKPGFPKTIKTNDPDVLRAARHSAESFNNCSNDAFLFRESHISRALVQVGSGLRTAQGGQNRTGATRVKHRGRRRLSLHQAPPGQHTGRRAGEGGYHGPQAAPPPTFRAACLPGCPQATAPQPQSTCGHVPQPLPRPCRSVTPCKVPTLLSGPIRAAQCSPSHGDTTRQPGLARPGSREHRSMRVQDTVSDRTQPLSTSRGPVQPVSKLRSH